MREEDYGKRNRTLREPIAKTFLWAERGRMGGDTRRAGFSVWLCQTFQTRYSGYVKGTTLQQDKQGSSIKTRENNTTKACTAVEIHIHIILANKKIPKLHYLEFAKDKDTCTRGSAVIPYLCRRHERNHIVVHNERLHTWSLDHLSSLQCRVPTRSPFFLPIVICFFCGGGEKCNETIDAFI